ncbi:MAG: TolC family protein [Desulforhabdus sp.]|jgi:NodT family efflux transporter outer membrane factor (OMF) lipoprotein|nr:TolC family protein [Desulforhabdus sp.]
MPSVPDSSLRYCHSRKLQSFAGWCLLSVSLVAAASCAVGPDYQPPSSKVPQAWRGASPPETEQMSVITTTPPELADWWRHFSDPVLISLVERAIESNLDLAQARARIRQARAARGIVTADFWPGVNASADYRRSGSGSSGGTVVGGDAEGGLPFVSGGGAVERDLFEAGLDATWELDIFGGVRRDIEAADADIRASVEDLRDVLVSLVAEVGTNYVSLRSIQERIAIAERNLKAQEHTAEITRKRFEAGFVSRLDVANASAQVATTRSQIPLLESAEQGTIYTISVLLGLDPGALAAELSAQEPIPPIPLQVPVGLPSDLLRRRPDIRRAEAQIRAATARIGVATADLFPRFSLTGSFGFSSSDLATFLNWSNRLYSLGPSVIWPVFDAGRIRANIELQKAIQEETLLAYRSTVLTALRDVETALAAYAKEQQHRAALEEAVVNNRKAVDLATQLYVAGRTDFLNVLAAENALHATEDELAVSTGNQAANLIALYKALGGGWQQELWSK